MSLPQELIDQVLFRLPVKPLRFRCVSKGWRALIDSNEFVKKHLKRMIECNARGVIINGYDRKFYLADFESLEDGGDDVAVPITGPLKSLLSGADFFGAANGLVCMAKNQMNELLIFNPSTRKVQKIPSAPAYFPRSLDCSEIGLCGFGYDHVNDDYKIVKIAECNVKFCGIIVIVYSLKTNSWKRIQNVPSDTQFLGDRGLFANGALHWFAINGPINFSHIVCFDLVLEQFKEIPFPPNGTFGRSLVPVEESLGILYKYHNSRVDVWLMNNSGAGNLWSKALSLKQPGPLGTFSFVRPVVFSKSHKEVLLEVDSAKLVWYDLKRKTVKNVRIRGIPTNFESYLYTESLLQLTEDKEDRPQQKPSQDKQGKKQQKKRDDFLSKGFKLKL